MLQNGRVLFTRWDTGAGNDGLHLYTTNPDGTDMQLHYGALSHATGTNGTTNDTDIEFMRAREMRTAASWCWCASAPTSTSAAT